MLLNKLHRPIYENWMDLNLYDEGFYDMNIEDHKKDELIKLAEQISKYAFMVAFYSSYPSGGSAQIKHCLDNLTWHIDKFSDVVNLIQSEEKK